MTSETRKWMVPTILSLLIWGVWAFLPKLALETMAPPAVLVTESFGGVIVAFVFFLTAKKPVKKDITGIKWIAVQVAFVVTASIAYLFALKSGPVATVVTLTAMYPVVSALLAFIFLKEHPHKRQYIAMAMAMGAVYLLAG